MQPSKEWENSWIQACLFKLSDGLSRHAHQPKPLLDKSLSLTSKQQVPVWIITVLKSLMFAMSTVSLWCLVLPSYQILLNLDLQPEMSWKCQKIKKRHHATAGSLRTSSRRLWQRAHFHSEIKRLNTTSLLFRREHQTAFTLQLSI